MDHYILEKLRPSAYCRYMDDFIIWTSSQKQSKDMFIQVSEYVNKNLCLAIKPPVFGKIANGLPFLGFLVKDKGIYLMQKSKRRVKERMKEITALLHDRSVTEEKAAERVRSVFAAIALARTNRFRKKIVEKGERLRTKSSMGLTV